MQGKVERPLTDGCGRRVTYLRLSMTDRCNFRCLYCMPLDTSFVPRSSLLSFEELERLSDAFIARGVRKIRLTGGEPLVRHGVMAFVDRLGTRLRSGALEEVTLTTNGWLLSRHAGALVAAGVRRVNVSLDTLEPARFRAVTRTADRLGVVLDGIETALAAGLRVKINTVALAGFNDDEFPALVDYAHARGMDITFIETMPLGDVDMDRREGYLPVAEVRRRLAARYRLEATDYRSSGPAAYVQAAETGGRIGFIGPVSHCFCEACNKVRLSCTGMLYTCLGQEERHDLRAALRSDEAGAVDRTIDRALAQKAHRHDFDAGGLGAPALERGMYALGG
jgi:cyclic pyranopterin phosphate synthase